jgi:hypothetical protein
MDGESYLHLLNQSTGRNVYVIVTQEHVWRVILEFVEYIDWKICLCKCYTQEHHGWMTILETIG